MRVVVAPDKYAGTLTAVAAAEAVARGWRSVRPEDDLVLRPVADGGEGTVDVIAYALRRATLRTRVPGPLGESVVAESLLLDDVAVVEMAAAAGLRLLPPDQRDPRRTSTVGVAHLVCGVVDRGARRVVLGLGGSATNDGGAGFVSHLGARLLDRGGRELPAGGSALRALDRIDLAGWWWPAFSGGAEVVAASDVTNPLCGRDGASAVFGPQKGADATAVAELEDAMRRWIEVVERDVPGAVGYARAPGAGAAGGLGFALMAFLGAAVEPGLPLVADLVGLPSALDGADLVVTGEGRLDGQSLRGKAPVGVAALAATRGLPCVAIAGEVTAGEAELRAAGFAATFSLVDLAGSVDAAMAEAARWLAAAAGDVAKRWSPG